jgi:hypothetical protein
MALSALTSNMTPYPAPTDEDEEVLANDKRSIDGISETEGLLLGIILMVGESDGDVLGMSDGCNETEGLLLG